MEKLASTRSNPSTVECARNELRRVLAGPFDIIVRGFVGLGDDAAKPGVIIAGFSIGGHRFRDLHQGLSVAAEIIDHHDGSLAMANPSQFRLHDPTSDAEREERKPLPSAYS